MKVRLDDGVFSLMQDNSKEGSSFPIKMAAVQIAESEENDNFLIDIRFNDIVYHFKTDVLSEFEKWVTALKGSAGVVEGEVKVNILHVKRKEKKRRK